MSRLPGRGFLSLQKTHTTSGHFEVFKTSRNVTTHWKNKNMNKRHESKNKLQHQSSDFSKRQGGVVWRTPRLSKQTSNEIQRKSKQSNKQTFGNLHQLYVKSNAKSVPNAVLGVFGGHRGPLMGSQKTLKRDSRERPDGLIGN